MGIQVCAAAGFDVFKQVGKGRRVVLGVAAVGKIIESLLNFSPQGLLRPLMIGGHLDRRSLILVSMSMRS